MDELREKIHEAVHTAYHTNADDEPEKAITEAVMEVLQAPDGLICAIHEMIDAAVQLNKDVRVMEAAERRQGESHRALMATVAGLIRTTARRVPISEGRSGG